MSNARKAVDEGKRKRREREEARREATEEQKKQAENENKLKQEADSAKNAGKADECPLANEKETILRDDSQIKNGKLQPNVKYVTGEFEYVYETDSKGRIISWTTEDLQPTVRNERLVHDPNTPGKLA